MPSNLEKQLRHKSKQKGLLVPLLEDLFQNPVEIESESDVVWLSMLVAQMAARQQTRQNDPLFSPSQLSECLRYVFLLKNHDVLEIPKLKLTKIEPNFYFFNGNFLHIKWQFALWKLDKHLPDEIFKLYGVEVPIVSKRKDHGGTVDALVAIYGELCLVDFKGLNVRAFANITHGSVPESYLIQIPDYAMLYNSQRNGAGRILRGLLVVENKGGPDPKHPIALHEREIPIDLYLPKVRTRLAELREHDVNNTLPPPECISTQTIQFQSCPFRKFCRSEVKEIERINREKERAEDSGLQVRTPNGRGTRKRQRL